MRYSILDFTELVYSNDLKPNEDNIEKVNYNLFKPPQNDTNYYYFTEVHKD